jgi:hypothetical protein
LPKDLQLAGGAYENLSSVYADGIVARLPRGQFPIYRDNGVHPAA